MPINFKPIHYVTSKRPEKYQLALKTSVGSMSLSKPYLPNEFMQRYYAFKLFTPNSRYTVQYDNWPRLALAYQSIKRILKERVLPRPSDQYSVDGTLRSAHENKLIWLSPLAAQANIIRCGWKAVAEMGDWRAWCKKLEYGSTLESSLPSKLKTLTVWFPVPLQIKLALFKETERK